MPKFTIKDIEDGLSKDLWVDRKHSALDIASDKGELKMLKQQQSYIKCIQNIWLYKIGSFDTENDPATVLLIGDLIGNCFALNNFHEYKIPTELLKLLEDESVYWIQSGVQKDVQLLRDRGIHVKTWADSGFFYRMIVDNSEEMKFGRKAQAELLGQTDFPFFISQDERCNFGSTSQWSRLERLHAKQDVRVPLGMLLKASLRYIQLRKYHPYTDLSDTVSKHTFDACKNISGASEQNWMSSIYYLITLVVNIPHPTPVRESNMFPVMSSIDVHNWLPRAVIQDAEFITNRGNPHLHDVARVVAEYQKFPLFDESLIPTFEPEKSLDRKIELIKERWKCFHLPTDGRSINNRIVCKACVKPKHRKGERCPIAGERVECLYPLCNLIRAKHQHKITVCFSLHKLCSACGMRGHFPVHHEKYSVLELRHIFLTYAHMGMWTSLVYLDANNPTFWMYHLNGTRRIDPKVALEAGFSSLLSPSSEFGPVIDIQRPFEPRPLRRDYSRVSRFMPSWSTEPFVQVEDEIKLFPNGQHDFKDDYDGFS